MKGGIKRNSKDKLWVQANAIYFSGLLLGANRAPLKALDSPPTTSACAEGFGWAGVPGVDCKRRAEKGKRYRAIANN